MCSLLCVVPANREKQAELHYSVWVTHTSLVVYSVTKSTCTTQLTKHLQYFYPLHGSLFALF